MAGVVICSNPGISFFYIERIKINDSLSSTNILSRYDKKRAADSAALSKYFIMLPVPLHCSLLIAHSAFLIDPAPETLCEISDGDPL
jgi:hypothetical protein